MTKRYSVWGHIEYAITEEPEYKTWAEANTKRKQRWPDMKIWDHSTTPPTDVTDADPEAVKRWWCVWNPEDGYVFVHDHSHNHYTSLLWDSENKIVGTGMSIKSPTAPTFTEFRAAVKAATGVEIPEPEEARWWFRDINESWSVANGNRPAIAIQQSGKWWCTIFATTADREAVAQKLYEAALAAGKGGEV